MYCEYVQRGESMQSSFSKFMKEQRDSSEELRQKDKLV